MTRFETSFRKKAAPKDGAPVTPNGRFKRDEIVVEAGSLGLILQSGDVAFDVLWIGGSTSRYRYSTRRHVRAATSFDLEGQDGMVAHLREEAEAARKERKSGSRIKRGQLHPSR